MEKAMAFRALMIADGPTTEVMEFLFDRIKELEAEVKDVREGNKHLWAVNAKLEAENAELRTHNSNLLRALHPDQEAGK